VSRVSRGCLEVCECSYLHGAPSCRKRIACDMRSWRRLTVGDVCKLLQKKKVRGRECRGCLELWFVIFMRGVER